MRSRPSIKARAHASIEMTRCLVLKLTLAALFTFAVLASFACSSATDTVKNLPTSTAPQSEPSAQPQQASISPTSSPQGTVELLDKGFFYTTSQFGNYVYYAFRVQNKDTTRAFEGTAFQ